MEMISSFEKQVSIAICEHNVELANDTKQLIEELFSQPELTKAMIKCDPSIYYKGEDLIKNKKEYDIVILDLDLGEGMMCGYDVARYINQNYEIEPLIIILTTRKDQGEMSYDFDIRAFSFLEKRPHNSQKVQEVVLKAVREIIDTRGVVVKVVNSGEKFFRPSEVRYIQKEGNETNVHVTNGAYYSTYLTLDEWLEILPKHQFLRTHKSNIVNLDYIIGFSRDKRKVILKDGQTGEIVKATKDKFKEFSATVLSHEKYLARRRM